MVEKGKDDTRVQVMRNFNAKTHKRVGKRVKEFQGGKGTSSYYRRRAGIEEQLRISYYTGKHKSPTYYEDMRVLDRATGTMDFVGKRFYHMAENGNLYCWTLAKFRKNFDLPKRGDTINVFSPDAATYNKNDEIVQGDPVTFYVMDSFASKDGKVVRLTVNKK